MSTYQADTFFLKQHSKSKVKFIALINVETRRAYAYHAPNLDKKTIVEMFNNWLTYTPDGQYPSVISSDLGSEFNSKDFYDRLEQKKVRLFSINKSAYKTSYAAAIVDRFIRTIKEKLERYQKLNVRITQHRQQNLAFTGLEGGTSSRATGNSRGKWSQ